MKAGKHVAVPIIPQSDYDHLHATVRDLRAQIERHIDNALQAADTIERLRAELELAHEGEANARAPRNPRNRRSGSA